MIEESVNAIKSEVLVNELMLIVERFDAVMEGMSNICSEPQIERVILCISSTQHCFALPTGLGLKLNLRNL